VVYQHRADDLGHAALTEAQAYRLTGDRAYAVKAAVVINAYAEKYLHYPIHDNSGKEGKFGARVYSQTLDESLWLTEMCWAYDLIRGSGALTSEQKQNIERNLLHASAETVGRASSPDTPTPSSQSDNIQSWVNTAVAAVGYVTNDHSLIQQALDGPLGFHYQMHHCVVDGFWIEGAWGYQFYTMRALVQLAQMARQAGTNLWKEEPNLLALFVSPLQMAFPDGSLPPFNDSHTEDIFKQSKIYAIAYAQTHDTKLLPVLEHQPPSTREAFLFGVETDSRGASLKSPDSASFPVAGYAVERGCKSDLTAIMKFGPHGGSHGHFDLLNEVIYAEGHILTVDPGTHNYSLPIHRDWDKMTIAHNTISVDEMNQHAGSGKLVRWQSAGCVTSATASTDEAYPGIKLSRTVIATSEYVVEVSTGEALDGKEHQFDWNYHNYGRQSLDLKVAPYDGFPKTNGYQYLSDVHRAISSETIRSTFALYSPASGGMHVTLLGGPVSEIFSGVAPDSQTKIPVPFLIVRRTGISARFVTLLQPFGSKSYAVSPSFESSGVLVVRGRGWTDTIQFTDPLEYSRTMIR
jgi:hypothetical protein